MTRMSSRVLKHVWRAVLAVASLTTQRWVVLLVVVTRQEGSSSGSSSERERGCRALARDGVCVNTWLVGRWVVAAAKKGVGVEH